MSVLSRSQSNFQGANTPREKTHALMEQLYEPNHTPASTCTGRNDHIGQCCISSWHKRVKKTTPDNHVGLNSKKMSPAPLRLPPNKISHKSNPVPQNQPIQVYSEYLFPLPPTSMACSHNQASGPRSPFPPPYSSLMPSISTSSLKETPPKNNNSSFIKQSVHSVRRTQSSTDIQPISQWKPLPAEPLVNVNKREQGENKTWKQTIFRLTPASNVATKQEINTPCRTNPNVNVTYGQRLPPPALASLKEPLPNTVKNRGKLQEEKQAKGKKLPDIKPQDITDTSRNEHSASKDSSGSEEGSSGDRERLTTEQILWLHQNYRGEATFLKAWGLHITRNADRERGLEIMRELMAVESSKGKERQINGQLEKPREQNGRSKLTTPRDREGLQAIEEERNTY
ncbi:hypothetical protein F4781DRAFT_438696 [Annulohypoxylon bovei var. microspora]|nr:hypothetical protein F4781DRAFT_438696 [Annulohypoxylon bovei var. microspora]